MGRARGNAFPSINNAFPFRGNAFRLKRKWRNGTTEVVFERSDFISRLAALVPAPRVHLRTFHGVLGPAAKWRALIVASADCEPVTCGHLPDSSLPNSDPEVQLSQQSALPKRKNYSWSELLKRVFDIDLVCERCGGTVRLIATIHPPDATEKILNCLGLPSKPPPIAPPATRTFTPTYA